MIADHNARLRRLEKRADLSGDDFVLFGRTEADGRDTAYHLLNDGKTYSPAAFDRLVEARADAVFVALQSSSALAEAAAQAYWEEREATQLTWDEMKAENALVESILREVDDDYAGDDAEEEVSRRIASALGAEDGIALDGGADDGDGRMPMPKRRAKKTSVGSPPSPWTRTGPHSHDSTCGSWSRASRGSMKCSAGRRGSTSAAGPELGPHVARSAVARSAWSTVRVWRGGPGPG